MRKLMRAYFARLWKSKVFWLALAAIVGVALYSCIDRYQANLQYKTQDPLSDVLFVSYMVTGMAMAALCSLFIGTEYSDGTIRNQIVAGSKRRDIYLAQFITCAAAGVLTSLAGVAVTCAVGIPLLGSFEIGIPTFLLMVFIGCLAVISFAALFTVLAMLVQNKAVVAVISLLVIFFALLEAVSMHSTMTEPEFYDTVMVTESGSPAIVEKVPNPNYLSESERAVYQTIMDILPTGQCTLLASHSVVNPGLMALYSVLITVLADMAGVYFFSRKDLK